ncbi:DUF192 domain-containing protein [Pseudomonas sp.]|uniref:DUF192 domain-containing protein n=1 Tax=Pseudomonas sp. TaxID=306 RepID=UPI003D1222C2
MSSKVHALRGLSSLVAAAALVCGLPPFAQAQERLPLRIGEAQLRVEVALSDLERARGLMERSELPADGGMLLRFEQPGRHCLWMRNTPLPLSAAFVDDAGQIVDLIDLEPLSTEIRCSKEPARYALEVNQGWFAEHAIGPGARVQGLPGE